jgi:hypothetical protein
MKRREFIQSEVWILSTFGAFQRANIYKNNISEIEKKHFRFQLKEFIINVLVDDYRQDVNEKTHVQNIEQLSDFSKNFDSILQGGKLNFGVSQKLLNLYLKYLWCMDMVATPPHFPVDSIIQKKLRVSSPVPWTKMTTSVDYLRIIDIAKELLPNHPYKTIAELELHLFDRN